MDPRAIGRHFDDPDDYVHWLHQTLFGLAAMNAVNRGGVTAELLKGPASAAELAERCGLPADRLGRVLDFLVAHELIEASADGKLHATRRTEFMHQVASGLIVGETSAFAGSQLLPSLQGDKTPFELHFGAPVFEYLGENPGMAAIFGNYMGFTTRRVERFLFSHHRFEPFKTVADIGGSMGDLLLGVLAEYPGTGGVLFDRPEVVELARPRIAASPFADRVELVGGSFFEAVPSADLYTLKQILHDWHDDECVQILSSIRKAIDPGGRLAVIDHLLSDRPAPDEAQGMDIAMMLWDTGRERKVADLDALFAASGFRVDRITRNPSGHSVVEAVPV